MKTHLPAHCVSPQRGLSCVLLMSPATSRVEQNSGFLKVPRRAFFPSPLTFCFMNASTVRQPPVAPSYLPVCTGAADSLLVWFHCLCWRELSFPRMLSASRGGAIFSFQKFVSVSQRAEHNTQTCCSKSQQIQSSNRKYKAEN